MYFFFIKFPYLRELEIFSLFFFNNEWILSHRDYSAQAKYSHVKPFDVLM